eukprot:Blabericola_migrator_1__10464@NODE_5926_length_640_cov_2_092496_g3925_i0_p1_GENE_NODE_5926_length_640_cov_2_092496_g3925_i0NODE_5926_length_640_cov_2_092496_g3925_i0_p1_ORF_typecomplete_len116_score20_74CPW_WPC/PF09717_10/0_0053FAM183/PF14886_6/0_065AAL_decarboxy/PF03306_13/0_3_NODE_5926_length_640_cov_2_092496_g3925_i0272619
MCWGYHTTQLMTFDEKAHFARVCEAPWPCAGYIGGVLEPPTLRGTWQTIKLHVDPQQDRPPFDSNSNYKVPNVASRVVGWMSEEYMPSTSSDVPDPIIQELPYTHHHRMPPVPDI